MPRVVIDPGHFEGYNQSAVVPEYIEGNRMLDLADMLGDALDEYGIEVFFTRIDGKENPSLLERGRLAGLVDADLFVSTHSNGVKDKKVRGTEIWIVSSRPDLNPLADCLGATISAAMGHHYRGTKTQVSGDGSEYYGVLRGAVASGCSAAMIIEHGFHSNEEDARWLLDDDNLLRLAQAQAKIIAAYFNIFEKVYDDFPADVPEEHPKENPQTGVRCLSLTELAEVLEEIGVEAITVE